MFRRIRSAIILGMAVFAAAFAFGPLAGAAPRSAETKNVTIKDFEFGPKELTINVGDSVVWKNEGPKAHTATASDGTFDSGNLNAGQEFSFTFTKAGTFAYVCKYHDSMQASITVSDGSAAPAAAAPAAQATGKVTAGDQSLVDQSITVANVTAGQDGWIVAHIDEGGAPGRVLGQTAVKKGENANVKIALSESPAVGAKLWPMLHIDAGALGTYEFPGADSPVIAASGKPEMVQIALTAAGTAPAAAQPSTLPRTGGSEGAIGLLAGALLLVLAGATLTLAQRRRAR